MKHLLAMIAVSIHRDITTTLSVQIPEHEVPILQSIHGEGNVYPGEATGAQTAIDASNEYSRLCDKYGDGPVREAYGTAAKGDIKRAVEKASEGEIEDDNTGIHLEGPDSKPKTVAKPKGKAKETEKA